jgi:hypothetical protein
MNFFIGFFLFLDRAASFHLGAVETPSCGILAAFAGHAACGSISLENYKFCLTETALQILRQLFHDASTGECRHVEQTAQNGDVTQPYRTKLTL